MPRYFAFIDYDAEEQAFGAMFPDADDCTAMGDSEDEVIANATDALAEWLSDMRAGGNNAPMPRSYAALLKAGAYDPDRGDKIAPISV